MALVNNRDFRRCRAHARHRRHRQSPRPVTVSRVLLHVRRGRIRGVHSIQNGDAEASRPRRRDLAAGRQAAARTRPPEGIRIGAIYRGGKVIIPHGDARSPPHDRVVIVAIAEQVRKVEQMFRVSLEFFCPANGRLLYNLALVRALLPSPSWHPLCRYRCYGEPGLRTVFLSPCRSRRFLAGAVFLASRAGKTGLSRAAATRSWRWHWVLPSFGAACRSWRSATSTSARRYLRRSRATRHRRDHLRPVDGLPEALIFWRAELSGSAG